MPRFMMIPLVGSFAGLLIVCLYRFAVFRNGRVLAAQVTALVAAAAFLLPLYYTPGDVTPKGDADGWAFVVVLYLFMLLGMAASSGYAWFSQPRDRRVRKKFDWGLALAPIFVSPIVFIPLGVAFLDVQVALDNMKTAQSMTFLVAFQNGFFWKEFFDGKRKELTAPASPGPKKEEKSHAPKKA